MRSWGERWLLVALATGGAAWMCNLLVALVVAVSGAAILGAVWLGERLAK